jgi:putative heme-binding domain-containing protein
MRRLLVIAVCLAAGAGASPPGAARAVAGERAAWTTSRVVGTPDPPLPFRTRPVWSGVRCEHPTLLAALPGVERMVVGEQAGRLWSFRTTPEVRDKDLVIDLRQAVVLAEGHSIEALYGLAFDPQFATNRFVYLCYVIRGKAGEVLEDGSRVSRFRMPDADPPTIDPASELILLTFRAGGHNGGCLEFGPDGCLHVSTGDGAGPNPPDQLRTGQDCGDLLSSILRIDVAHATAEQPYRVPADNPFVGVAGVRPEIWAYGLRNPWKMTFDRETGDLWVADVGWDQWELVHRVTKGANLGWAAFEGVQPILPGLDHGPSAPQPPLVALPHTIAASVTGGYVYRGSRLPELRGAYVFGDWETKRVWGVRRDERGDAVLEDLADSGLQIVAFGEDHDGELVLADYGQGVLHGLERGGDEAGERPPFPARLGETGLFADTARQIPAAGVLPFEINQPQWSDFATARRWIALPGTEPIVRHPADRAIPGSMFQRQHDFPAGTVLAKTLSLETTRGDPASVRHVETQLLHFDGQAWRAYTYAWNDEQTDAALVPAEGAERIIEVRDDAWAGGRRRQRWAFAGRAQCLSCHTPWAQHALAFTPAQLHRDVPTPGDESGTPVNQLAWLEEHGWYRRVDASGAPLPPLDETALAEVPRLARRGEGSATPAALARGYLHVQCSHCHRFNGGGAGSFQLLMQLSDAGTGLLDEPARQGTLDLPDARLVVPGVPERSLLYVRMATFGRGRMPHLASELVDEEALGWIEGWIRGLAPEATGPQAGAPELAALEPVARALAAARAVGRRDLPPSDRDRLLAEAAEHPSSLVRDLFSGYQPPERQRRTLGTHVVPGRILALTGSALRGAALFAGAAGVQCRTCHRLDGTPGVGPDLRAVVGRRTREHLLESLVDPSRAIDPEWRTRVVETTAGRIVTGLVTGDDEHGITLRDATGREELVPRDQVESVSQSTTSLMPAGLLRDLSAEEAADLLAFLVSLGEPPTRD